MTTPHDPCDSHVDTPPSWFTDLRKQLTELESIYQLAHGEFDNRTLELRHCTGLLHQAGRLLVSAQQLHQACISEATRFRRQVTRRTPPPTPAGE